MNRYWTQWITLGTAFATGLWLACLLGCSEPADNDTGRAVQLDGQPTNEKREMTFERMSPLVKAYQDINKVLQLGPGESQRMDAVKSKHKKKFQNWYATVWQENKKREKKFLDAVKNRSLRQLREMKTNGERAKMDECKKQERRMQVEFEKDLLEAIPEDKMDQWKAHRIAVLLLEFLEPLALSKDQVASIKSAAPNVVRSLGREKNWQGYGTSKLEKRFERTVLKPNQKVDFEKLKKKKIMRMLRWNNQSASGF